MRLKIQIVSLVYISIIAGCDASTPKQSDSVHNIPDSVESPKTPLESLYPGQIIPDRFGLSENHAYLIIDLDQNDDATSGSLTLKIDGADEQSCEGLTENIHPWTDLCMQALKKGEAIIFEAPAVFKRETITIGEKMSVMGAHATLNVTSPRDPIYLSIIKGDYGDWELRTRSDDGEYISAFTSVLDLRTAEDLNRDITNSKMLILERRTKN